MVDVGFTNSDISKFKSYLSFIVNIENEYLDHGDLNCGVPWGSILGPYNVIYCCMLLLTRKNVINDQLNGGLFVDNKLCIHFGED